MDMPQAEIEEAKARITEHGADPAQYSFAVAYLPPDPDGAGMFTVQYEIAVTHKTKTRTYIGGIGSRWVNAFANALKDGYFD